MGLAEALWLAHEALARCGVEHALIGALAMAEHGVQRATLDVDLLVDGDRRADARGALLEAGFGVFYESEDVLQVGGPGAVDIIFARRAPTREMLAAAKVAAGTGVKCVCPEGVIALKVQAYVNDRRRELRDKADIQALVRALRGLDWARLKAWVDLRGEWPAIQKIRDEG